MNMAQQKTFQINQRFYNFINDQVLSEVSLNQTKFWDDFIQLVRGLTPANQRLLQTRSTLQSQLNTWHETHKESGYKLSSYEKFLTEIGYIVDQGEDFVIETENLDREITSLSGPQLVVPVNNARFALNAANARWGSLYDALYGTDVIAQETGLKTGKKYNKARGNRVIAYAKGFLDKVFPLTKGTHHNVSSYLVYYQHLLVLFPDGSTSGLKKPGQFAALSGSKNDPTSILLVNNGLHLEIKIDRKGSNGSIDFAGVQDILIESATSSIMDFEDSVSTVDGEDKISAYKNWLGLMKGDLQSSFIKEGEKICRTLEHDKRFTTQDGEQYRLPGRALLLVRNVGHLMDTELMQDEQGYNAPEGIVDAVVTALIASIDLQKNRLSNIQNSKSGSIYIVKPKMHGPEEVEFTCTLFSRVEKMLGLDENTIKLGIMDEERRATLNLKACIRAAKERIFFINTGFLDRTGDEIHSGMQAGAFLPKAEIKQQAWIAAYEDRNVDIGLACGFQGRAQIGKGMWAMPDEMKQMMDEKINHPLSGASTAWVPSPTAATLHALHYHFVKVTDVQEQLKSRSQAKLTDLLSIALLENDLPQEVIEKELENNIQGILGYVVRWVELGIGCSKVPDINHIGLMEDRATLRISSQHIANWLLHGICTRAQVEETLQRMAKVVDKQNESTEAYQTMVGNLEQSLAFQAASELIFKAIEQPSGYTEPLLHHYRLEAKKAH
ncbi:MAG: malate synthase G [Gammaproteobacteria bacterium]|nr:MAG: malate synthase G [Gammaproteobacteria bacterium]